MGQFQSINSVESVSTWLKGSGLWQRPRDWRKLATRSQTPADMPGIPVGDHYPETHTVGAPPQVPVSGSETVSPASEFPLRHSSVQTTEALPSDTAGPVSGTFDVAFAC